jgi:PEGA domain
MLSRLVGATALCSLSSCATIISGGSDTITINSLEPGTRISVDGVARGIDVCSVDLKRGDDHVIRAEKEGYTPVQIQTGDKFDGTSLLGIFIDFGIISIPIDLIGGGGWEIFPKTYTVTPLKPSAAVSPTAPAK